MTSAPQRDLPRRHPDKSGTYRPAAIDNHQDCTCGQPLDECQAWYCPRCGRRLRR
jgi:hypothetical protein